MLLLSVRLGSRFAFKGQTARFEVCAMDMRSHARVTFVGNTLKEAFDSFEQNNGQIREVV